MTTTSLSFSPAGAGERADTLVVLGLLEELQHGMLEVRLPDGGERLFGHGTPMATLQVYDERTFTAVLRAGDIGLAEAYLDGWWDSPDLAALMTLLANNGEALKGAIYGNWRALLKARLRHWLNANTRSGSKRNIMAALAEKAINTFGVELTGVTLSTEQLAFAQQRNPGADLRLQDYRDLDERFDHVVSIEMFEAVGERYWPTYFRTLARSLKPGGKAVVQSIVIRDDLFASYRRGTDFIQQYIFPGGMLPSPSVFAKQAAKAGLQVTDQFAFGKDYGRTLALWRERFEAQWAEIVPLGFDERFRRLWRMYFAYCEAGFMAGSIDVIQFELQHADA